MTKNIQIVLVFLFVSVVTLILSSDTMAYDMGSGDKASRITLSDKVVANIKDFNRSFGLTDWLSSQPAFFVAPTISSISPSSPQTSVTDQNIRINGSNFVSGLTVTVTFPSGGTGTLSGSQIVNVTSSSFTAKITLNATGTWKFRVNNPNGEMSALFSFNVTTAQTPTISSISPSSPTVSSSNQNVQVNGSNFQDGLTVTVFFPGGGSSTLSGTQITNVTTSSFTMVVTLNVLGTYGIRVNNPSNLSSGTFNFSTQQPTPTISSITPSGVCAQSGDRTFTVSGTNFVSGLTVTVFFPGGGSSTLSGSQIQFSSSTSFNMIVTLNVVGTYNFRVNNPSGAQSALRAYTTQDCNPNVTSISPSTPTVSNTDQTVGVSGSNFLSGLTVTIFFPGGGSGTLSGSQIQFSSSTSFNMIVTLNVVGQYQIRVNNPNGTTSSNFSFNTQAAPPTISSVSPTTPCVRNVDQSIVVNGANFVSGLTVTVFFPGGGSGTLSGTQIQSVTSTSFTMVITLGEPGSYGLRVNNPSGAQSATFSMLTQNCLNVSGINPATPTQSNVDQNIVVNGSGFAANLSVIVTLPDTTTVTLSGAQIVNVTTGSFTMKITLNGTGTWKIKVRNPNGDLSNLFSFTVQAPAAPSVSSINPTTPTASNIDQNVVVNGTNFQSGLTVTLTFPGGGTGTLSGTQIQNVTSNSFTMRVTLGGAGSWSMRVNNPGGGQSGPFGFTVASNTVQPVIYSINPASPIARSTDQDVIVSGANFQQSLQVPITFPGGGGTTLSGTQIQNVTSTSFIMRATLNAAGGWTIRVNNPDGGQSAIFSFSVSNGTNPVINSINPATPTAGGADQNVIVSGSNFQNGLKVNVSFPNGGIGTLQGSGQIQNVTANSFTMRITLNGAGSWTIRVVNPDNSQSQQFAFNVNASGPPPTGLPTSVLSPVIGPLRVTTSNQGINDDKWEFNQHRTGYHTATGGISLSNDSYAWDINLYTPTSGNADVGKSVFATAPGQVVSYVGTLPGGGSGSVLIAHPNANSPVWFSGYLHLTNIHVTLGQNLDQSSIIGDIGRVGADNDHLHFAVYSGTNSRGNLQSFNVPVTERLASTVNPPTVASIFPNEVIQSPQLQLVNIVGANFQTNSVILVNYPDGSYETVTPQSVTGFESSPRIVNTTATAITALISISRPGSHRLSVMNSNNLISAEGNQLATTEISQADELNVLRGPRRTPIILIPGMMGSVLKTKARLELFPFRPHWFPGANDRHRQLKDNIGDERSMDLREVVATDVFRDYVFSTGGYLDYYEKLINFLVDDLGYVEYDSKERPERRTYVGCDRSQTNADLFLFAYDWRNKNEISARDLRDFVRCVKDLYGGDSNPNFKFQIVAHSNGGLVARRYILDGLYGSNLYPPYVERMITLGTPWLGAPKAIPVLYSGNFDGVNSLIDPNVLKEIGRYMPGPHELLPSRLYVDQLGDQTLPADSGDYPFGEDRWDIDQSGQWETIYSFGRFENFMNRLRPDPNSPIRPGTNSDLFHNKLFGGRNLQDNWLNDPTGIQYYNFRGESDNNTIGTMQARSIWQGNQMQTKLEPLFARGDGTVTSISASRQSGRGNYQGPVTDKVFRGVSHQKLTSDSSVLTKIECVLETSLPSTCLSLAPTEFGRKNVANAVDDPVYALKISGSRSVLISDSFGNTIDPLSDSQYEGVPTVETVVSDVDFLSAFIPLDQSYQLIFQSSSTAISIRITKGVGPTTVQTIRYMDLVLPPNVMAMIGLSPQGVTTLTYDSDGNGTFDTPVSPTIIVNGTNAQDLEPPTLNLNETVLNGSSRVELDASDSGTGVQRIMYSLNGTTFQQYSTALILNPAVTPTIYAYADDNVFNRSGLITKSLTASNAGFSVGGPSSAPAGGQATASWNAPTGRPVDDWIGLFRNGTLNSAYVAKQYTNGTTSGNLNFVVPNQPGTYEFRYLLSDGFTSVTASSPFTVGTVASTPFDFDGDSKSDLSIFRPAQGEWWVSKSSNGGNFATQFGTATDTVVPADFTGDGKTDVAYWRPSTGFWYVLRSEDFTFYAFPFGAGGDVPVPADFDGDGKADAGVFRPSAATWYISRSSGGTTIQQFGLTTDKPVPADYDGDGKADLAVFRPTGANGAEWWISKSSGGTFATQFGSSTDKAVPADYTGDGKADVAFWIPSTGQWFILRSEDLTYYAFPFGGSGDAPVPGDYDGDGKTDAAVFRPSNSTWYANRSTAGVLIQQFGQAGDVPVPNAFVR